LIFYNTNSFNNYKEFGYLLGQSAKPLRPSDFNVSITDWHVANNQWTFSGETYLQETRAMFNASDSYRLEMEQRYFCYNSKLGQRYVTTTRYAAWSY
jgi:hypothetical protein